ncbi:hypothetical protein PV11_01084 [Exophiala sideris]|uniref:BHLH domain-containing protein n=1 Tax=Exophiala sideris TaxID=1016849 RepID=A0A0D1XBU3_9EURO|nr:hypothetical protein PV11_01084 [Exophiala sideris]
MPYSHLFNQYQDQSYYNQQQPWNEVDFTTSLQPPNDNLKSTEDTAFYDINNLPADSQSAPSPNYSQFLNFESSDVGSYSVPSENGPSEAYPTTSPTSFNASLPTTNYAVKLEPDLMQNDAFSCRLSNGPTSCSPQQCGQEPACLQLASLAEIEECSTAPFSTTNANEFDFSAPVRKSSRSMSGEPNPKPKAQQREKPTRSKRGVKSASSDEDSAQLRAKQAHSVVERRYRDNLNGKIMQLHSALVATEANSRLTGMPAQDFYTSRDHRGKVRKSDVMTDAMNYIHQSEVEFRHMTDEIGRLNERVRTLEGLVKCEDCTLLKQMVRLQLQQQQQPLLQQHGHH